MCLAFLLLSLKIERAGAPYGDAILAGVATGVLPGFSIAKKWAEYIDYQEPSPEKPSDLLPRLLSNLS